jgi:site-specific recombinase XerD
MEDDIMIETLILEIKQSMNPFLDNKQMEILDKVLKGKFINIKISEKEVNNQNEEIENKKLLEFFISAKKIEGCSNRSLSFYKGTLENMIKHLNKSVKQITTNDLRQYLFEYQEKRKPSKITIDNIRRILSSFFSWLEDEDYILKNPVRRIHKIKVGTTVKEVYTDESMEIMRDSCKEMRDIAIIDLLISTGIRVGELVNLNVADIDFNEKECIVLGKGDKERKVYFDARTKIHLKKYLENRMDENPALFVTLLNPHNRLKISGVEIRFRELGKKLNIPKVHPHKFRRTMATKAIDKGMPIEQVQKLLGHTKIDTTLQYAMVNQNNVKNSHRKYIG